MHEIGLNINSKKRQQHGAYILEHSEMPGFSISEREMIKQLVRYHRGKLTSDDTLIENKRFSLLVVLLRLSIICTPGRLNLPVLSIKLTVGKDLKDFELLLNFNEQVKSNKGLIDALIEEQQRLNNLNVTLSFNPEFITVES